MSENRQFSRSQSESGQRGTYTAPLFSTTVLLNTPMSNGYSLLRLSCLPELFPQTTSTLCFIFIDKQLLAVMQVFPQQSAVEVLCLENARYQRGTEHKARFISIPIPTIETTAIPLFIAEDIYIGALVFFLQQQGLQRLRTTQSLCLLYTNQYFPFNQRPSLIHCPAMPHGVIGAMPLLDDWGIVSRLASEQELIGCYEGHISHLLRYYLNEQNKFSTDYRYHLYCIGSSELSQRVQQDLTLLTHPKVVTFTNLIPKELQQFQA
ncbi:hypothetical protein BegalDRAFT_0285 [Beggiatoa alba B18LD]|uniref:Uncharacterized protein n=1 Tax=Beggiatoa alba B18LD TaxID=395493 RepID=I3CC64_9GAMM|nr:hypothetical protein [Beggiatoa alba]EIJ41207.1 hypothetical protein BegalDRAFT_0285 [Beggiatoa alba B18LD]